MEEGVRLTISPQVLNTPQTRLPIRNRRVEIMLLAILVHRESLEINIPARSKLRLDRTWDVDGRLHPELRDAVFHDGEFDRDDAGHFDGAAEGYFTEKRKYKDG